jgi:hypothetical protein
MYKTGWILEGSSNCCLNFALHYNSKYCIGILPMVFWSPIPMVYRFPTHGILTPLPMVYRTAYPWYIKPHIYGISNPLPMVFWPPAHGILNILSIVNWTPYLWYFDPHPWYIEFRTHGILNPLPMLFWPLPMVYRTPNHVNLIPYPWYYDPLTHGILNSLPNAGFTIVLRCV